MELRLLNKKCGCKCCLSLYNSASLESFSACNFRLSISFCSSWLYHNKLKILILLINKNPAPKRILLDASKVCVYASSFLKIIHKTAFRVSIHKKLTVRLTTRMYQYFSWRGR